MTLNVLFQSLGVGGGRKVTFWWTQHELAPISTSSVG
jgi:hypothetical protein